MPVLEIEFRGVYDVRFHTPLERVCLVPIS